MGLFKCNHDWKLYKESNILQFDDYGYPLRLSIMKCSKCQKYDQQWNDIPIEETEELRTGESFLLEWKKPVYQ